MCFNPEVSLATYVVGMTGCFQLYSKGYIPEAIFFAWVIQMQLVEYFIWRNQSCDQHVNKFVSKIGILVNHTEPIVLWLAILYFSKRTLPSIIQMFMVFFVIVSLLYTYNVWNSTECTTVTQESAPHLHWKWNEGSFSKEYYMIFLMSLALLSYYGLPNGHINATLSVLSFVISKIIYGEKHSVGAMWCFAAAFAPWFLLGSGYYV
jgi:hypothetical protein